MPHDSFFLNYGGPGDYWIADIPEQTDSLIAKCTSYYGGYMFKSQSSCLINEVRVTLYAFGVHRALQLELPADASQATIDLFYNTKKAAAVLCKKEYKLTKNNCATTAAAVLHMLDESIAPMHITSPWALDDQFKAYIARSYNDEQPTLKIFFNKYQQEVASEFPFFKTTPHWTHHRIESLSALIEKSHNRQFEERTRKVLFELGWVIGINAQNQFITGSAAPPDFCEGLAKYYAECKAAFEATELRGQTPKPMQ